MYRNKPLELSRKQHHVQIFDIFNAFVWYDEARAGQIRNSGFVFDRMFSLTGSLENGILERSTAA